jgi:hypothetical protein
LTSISFVVTSKPGRVTTRERETERDTEIQTERRFRVYKEAPGFRCFYVW